MVLPNGNLLKEKGEFFREKLMTKQGRFDLLVGSAIWGFIIVNYTKLVFDFIFEFFSFIPWNLLQFYLTYLSYGLLLIPISFGLSWVNIQTFKYLNILKKKIFGGR